ncbi:Aldehyde ferredoxin oxidoreductase [Georgfuchsia toluolica]|uniref:Aldehyde ferredoxin oxidoreductase n=1 Tax=Georgfuchsia toluolica TaxID=424218 RepID=A0A916J1X4_9PROT|nr:aldehyde ferredoxin oxidoreductase C-terminal domain-containing protein [Georgfuchsia toluolica]CAG4882316.1 Aldehyde ferredoxin oxidoreductase [Georgfuchsia toluolica]
MRKYLHIHLPQRTTGSEEFEGEALVRSGRHFIARTLLAGGIATVDPLSPENPLIFSAGPFAGSNFSNANRISVGCKSPLTGGIKEANSGGTFAVALGQSEIAGLTLHGASTDWVVIRITREGAVSFESAEPYLGLGTDEAAKRLFEKYGERISIALCGPVGEYLGLMAGISFTDTDGRPSRLAARGGVGAVMGSKKVKAIVVDLHKMPSFHDRKKLMGEIREYGARIAKEPMMESFRRLGTATMGDVMNLTGALPVNNFSRGQQVNPAKGTFNLGGDHVRAVNLSRGGEPTHACMPGCQIECSNVYVDRDGKELVSPLEYESLGLMGSNLGLTHPDDVARLNAVANDLGVDSIEAGAVLGVLLEDGQAAFGDMDFLLEALEDIRRGNERGLLLAQGAARVGTYYKVRRVPTIKGQAISAYDPRVIEVTGISMMLTAQGADHTAGAAATFDCTGKTTAELVAVGLAAQIAAATADSLGLCIFGRAVTAVSDELIIKALNAACGTDLQPSFLQTLGRETLLLEWEFNKAAGFTEDDNGLPDFFYTEALPPSGKVARHSAAEVSRCLQEQLAVPVF